MLLVYMIPQKKGSDLLDYNIEQLGDIAADYFADNMWSRGLWATRDVYEDVLENFLQNPMYPTNGRLFRKARSRLRRLDR